MISRIRTFLLFAAALRARGAAPFSRRRRRRRRRRVLGALPRAAVSGGIHSREDTITGQPSTRETTRDITANNEINSGGLKCTVADVPRYRRRRH